MLLPFRRAGIPPSRQQRHVCVTGSAATSRCPVPRSGRPIRASPRPFVGVARRYAASPPGSSSVASSWFLGIQSCSANGRPSSVNRMARAAPVPSFRMTSRPLPTTCAISRARRVSRSRPRSRALSSARRALLRPRLEILRLRLEPVRSEGWRRRRRRTPRAHEADDERPIHPVIPLGLCAGFCSVAQSDEKPGPKSARKKNGARGRL